jgi:predicted methyltransferase
VNAAIAREKQLKGWRRIKKIQLIVNMNPTWSDLAADWYLELNTYVLRLALGRFAPSCIAQDDKDIFYASLMMLISSMRSATSVSSELATGPHHMGSTLLARRAGY